MEVGTGSNAYKDSLRNFERFPNASPETKFLIYKHTIRIYNSLSSGLETPNIGNFEFVSIITEKICDGKMKK